MVIHPEDQKQLQFLLKEYLGHKPVRAAAGGAERQDSSLAGVRAAASAWVAIHDAARPLFSAELLSRVYDAARQTGAAIPTLPVVDSLRLVDAEQLITNNFSRENLHSVQTPQCFRRDLALKALEQACAQKEYFTDDAGAVLAMSGVRAKAIPGERLNLKVTTQQDLELAEIFLAHKKSSRVK